VIAAGCAAALSAAGGCGAPAARPAGARPPDPVAQAGAITLFSGLSAVNMDERPGPDGLVVELFLHRPDGNTVLVTGRVELLLFAGPVPAERLTQTAPLITWGFDAPELRGYTIRKMGLWGYRLPLRWGPNVPEAESVTLVARYLPPSGRPVYSAPTAVSLDG
jgi:hypothetical protein